MRKKWDKFVDYVEWHPICQVILFLAALAVIGIPIGLFIKSHTSSEVYYTEGTVIDRNKWMETIVSTDSDGYVHSRHKWHYETQVKLENEAIFTDTSQDAYNHTAVGEPIDVKVTIWYWKGKYRDTTYSVR